ncbi:MAG: hypothetical protein ACREIC_29700 [Limisphaerales bacterium]
MFYIEMNKQQLRAFALRKPKECGHYIRGARDLDLTARHLLIQPEQIPKAAKASRDALADYQLNRSWRSLYNHDWQVCWILRAGALELEKLTEAK